MGFSAFAAPPMETTRTSSPYFSPNSAMAPASIASSGDIRSGVDIVVHRHPGIHHRFDRRDLSRIQRLL